MEKQKLTNDLEDLAHRDRYGGLNGSSVLARGGQRTCKTPSVVVRLVLVLGLLSLSSEDISLVVGTLCISGTTLPESA
eukprot:4428606-Amphidinium_carterae.1